MHRLSLPAFLALTLVALTTGAAFKSPPPGSRDIPTTVPDPAGMCSLAVLATCSPTGTCKACSNCSACKHCSKNGGTCSVCRGGQ